MRAICLTGLALVLVSCSEHEAEAPTNTDFQEALQLQLLDAQPGDVIEIPAGHYALNRSLSLTQDGVTIRGAGMDETVLSYKGQVAGAEGLLVTGDDFLIEDLSIEDTVGDALKVNESDGVTIRRVRVAWTGGPKTENGAYGFYPVQTSNVLIEDSVAVGASDAGIYVGQSNNVIVRNNRAEENVAGIEIENTQNADVYGNVATGNTGGILVFNMPNLSQEGGRVRIYDNDVYENDLGNFGHPGTPVASVPAGSGVVVNSHDDVEISRTGFAITGRPISSSHRSTHRIMRTTAGLKALILILIGFRFMTMSFPAAATVLMVSTSRQRRWRFLGSTAGFLTFYGMALRPMIATQRFASMAALRF